METSDFVELYERTLADVYRYASRLTGGDRVRTDELVQETYVSVLRRLSTDGPHPDLSTAYLIVACRSRFLDGIRRETRRRRREARAAAFDPAPIDAGAIDLLEPGDAVDALAALNDDQRAALVLRYVDDLEVADVARELGRSVRATESLLVRARHALRTAFRERTGS